MSWRTARSLETLRAEIDALAPNRSKATDGSIGDPAHAARCSRHNPNEHGVVTARDFTHDPAGGFDAHAAADRLAANPHPEQDYIISRGRVASRRTNWRWHHYLGSNRHDTHIHVGVGVGSDCGPQPPYDSVQPWGLTVEPVPAKIPPSTRPADPLLVLEHAMSAAVERIRQLYRQSRGKSFDPATADPGGWNHWMDRLLACNTIAEVRDVVDEVGALIYLEMVGK